MYCKKRGTTIPEGSGGALAAEATAGATRGQAVRIVAALLAVALIGCGTTACSAEQAEEDAAPAEVETVAEETEAEEEDSALAEADTQQVEAEAETEAQQEADVLESADVDITGLETGELYIKMKIPDDLEAELTDSDIFIITYEPTTDPSSYYYNENAVAGQLVVRAIDYIHTTTYTDSIAAGLYDITDIEYIGDNEAIADAGYGVMSDFLIESDDIGIFYLMIGESALTELVADYHSNVVIK